MDKLNILFKAYDFVAHVNPMHSAVSWIFDDGHAIYAVLCGRDARRASNAIYHALRAAGRRGVRRVPGKRGCWIVSYI
jgi:hypothetical protein